MQITREDLKNMYLEHLEEERIRIAKLVDEDFNTVIREILTENKSGKKIYKRRCYEYSEDYLKLLLSRIQSIFVDSKINTEFINHEGVQKHVIITIDWS